MEAGTAFAVALTAGLGLAFVVVAALSLRSGSGLRRWYGVDPDDDAAVRSNALLVGATGVGLLVLAGGIALDVPGRVVGTATVLLAFGACIVLGWLVRYRDRRDLLTTPGVDRETAERLGASAMVCGLLVLPLAPAIWFGESAAVIAGIGLSGAAVGALAVTWAYR